MAVNKGCLIALAAVVTIWALIIVAIYLLVGAALIKFITGGVN